ncbi:MAG: hypothetical protein WAQ25_03500 [Candidatus Saccharimonas sp.]
MIEFECVSSDMHTVPRKGTTMPVTNILLGVIFLTLLGILWGVMNIMRRGVNTTATYMIDPGIEDAIKRIRTGIEHHAEVSAVLGLMKQLDADPGALELIKEHPKTVQAAAALHYVNTLGAALLYAQHKLQDAHAGNSRALAPFGNYKKAAIEGWQAEVDSIRAKLNAAVDACAKL